MKIIFTEGSIHHLVTLEMLAVPRVGEGVVIHNNRWIVDKVIHLPKSDGINHNESYTGWDVERDADASVHVKRV